MDVKRCKRKGVAKIVVDAGSSTGAHRDYKRAYRQIKNDIRVKKIVKAGCSYVSETKKPIHVVFGLDGAVGTATARILMDKIATINHCIVPSLKEDESRLVHDQFKWLISANNARYSLFVMVDNWMANEREHNEIASNIKKFIDVDFTQLPNLCMEGDEHRVMYNGWIPTDEITKILRSYR